MLNPNTQFNRIQTFSFPIIYGVKNMLIGRKTNIQANAWHIAPVQIQTQDTKLNEWLTSTFSAHFMCFCSLMQLCRSVKAKPNTLRHDTFCWMLLTYIHIWACNRKYTIFSTNECGINVINVHCVWLAVVYKLLTFCTALWPVPHNTQDEEKPKQTSEIHLITAQKSFCRQKKPLLYKKAK